MNDILNQAVGSFFTIPPRSVEPYGNGHINSTFLVCTDEKRYILQKVNTNVFKKPHQVMRNIAGVTAHIKAKAEKEGLDPTKATLTVIPTLMGKPYFDTADGQCWRLYEFIEDTVAPEKVECAQDFYNCAFAFGVFQQQLSDYPAEELFETIPNFHNTPWRFENLVKAVEADAVGRVASVKDEIDFALSRKDFCSILENAREAGELPLRVTHNDTKLNNILFDDKTGEAVCVIDLDTVMPGYSVNDFGDSIRFGANTAAEAETDLSKVSLDLELFRTYADGFIKGCGGKLTKKELELLPVGAMMMTFECGMRFLTDHLEGDVYFKIHRENHNLDRCRSQFQLVRSIESQHDEMMKLLNNVKKELKK